LGPGALLAAYAEHVRGLVIIADNKRVRRRAAERLLAWHPDLVAWMARPTPARLADLRRSGAWPFVTWCLAAVKDRGISSLSIIVIPHPVSTGGSGDYRVVVGGTSSLMRSATATGSSQDGQAPPRPTRWQNTPQSWQCCSPR